jgi:RNA polymerase-binding transcription factor DksA
MFEALAFHASRIEAHSDEDDHDLGLAMRTRSLRAREEITTALEMIEEGRYGVCVACEGPIARERLEAVPHALVCSRCARA